MSEFPIQASPVNRELDAHRRQSSRWFRDEPEIGQYSTSFSKTDSVTRLASAMARLKKNLMGPSRSSPTLTSRDATIDQETIMKISAIALAAAFALSGTAAFANTVHHKVAVTTDRAATGMVQLHRTTAIRTAIRTVRPR